MYKHLALLEREEGTSHEAFVDRLQTEHVSAVAELPGVVRHATVLPVDPEAAEFDGIAELYFEDRDALRSALDGAAARDPAVPTSDERRRFVGEEVVQKDEVGTTDGLYKHSAFLVRKDGMSHDDFREYWENEHTPLARDIEGVVRYHTVYPTDPDESAFDGVAELYFETVEALYDALGSPGSRDYDPTKEVAAEARADVDNFLAVEERPRLIGEETVHRDETSG